MASMLYDTHWLDWIMPELLWLPNQSNATLFYDCVYEDSEHTRKRLVRHQKWLATGAKCTCSDSQSKEKGKVQQHEKKKKKKMIFENRGR
mmetsp:Transcript_24043/g.47134  ORF Transcript_24043/g.47134 Transcript_24043/m.47134 type:complete len:90 (-) Transcript_24043:706-975(-)